MTDPALAETAQRLETIRERVVRAAVDARRDPSSVQLLAVTKGHGVEVVRAAAQLGLEDVGESRVQEAEAKQALYSDAALRWHMVGHLQRNKARAAATLFHTIHSVDSASLAATLARHRAGATTPLHVFIEVELTGIAGRSGVSPERAAELLTQVRALPELSVDGLMTIAAPGPPDQAARCFARLRELRDTLADGGGVDLPGLSMGMSGDFEVAIAQGATVIRLGRALFGDPSGPGR